MLKCVSFPVVRQRQEEKRQQEESSKVKERKRKREKYAEKVQYNITLMEAQTPQSCDCWLIEDRKGCVE